MHKNPLDKTNYDKEYYILHKKRILLRHLKYKESHSRWYFNNKERVAKNVIEWNRSNFEKKRQMNTNRKIRVRGAEGSHTLQEWNQLKIKHQYKCMLQISSRCLITLTDKTATRDHIVPISKGGLNSIGNIVPVCRSCNSSKGVKIESNSGVTG